MIQVKAALTPGRSLAVDRAYFPLGVPFWLDAALDDGKLQRVLIAQDTSGALRGPVRGDVFWGHGPDAERRAGTLRARHLFLAAAQERDVAGVLSRMHHGVSPVISMRY